jgi:hypothetical protein
MAVEGVELWRWSDVHSTYAWVDFGIWFRGFVQFGFTELWFVVDKYLAGFYHELAVCVRKVSACTQEVVGVWATVGFAQRA